MAKRVLIAGIVGGIVMFFWGFAWHELLGLGLVGIKDMPSEQAIVATMKANVPERGMYMVPGMNIPANATSEQKKAAEEAAMKKAAAGPTALLIYSPSGNAMTPRMLMTEAGTDIVQALLVAFLLAQTGLRRFGSRLGFAFVIGLVATITTNISYWNWFGFPTDYTIGNMSYLILGYFLIGLVVASIVKGSAGSPRPQAASAAA